MHQTTFFVSKCTNNIYTTLFRTVRFNGLLAAFLLVNDEFEGITPLYYVVTEVRE